MDFLALARTLRQKVGAPNQGPASVLDQVGEMADIVQWTNEAWHLIQTLEDRWLWMRRNFQFTTTSGKREYLPTTAPGEVGIADWGRWEEGFCWTAWRASVGRSDESYVVEWSPGGYRSAFDFGGGATSTGKPVVWSRRERDGAILLGPTPDNAYVIKGEYQAAPTPLLLDADVPGMPARFHMAIVYRAMMLYGAYEAAPEVFQEGQSEFNRMYAALKQDQLEREALAKPLA